MVDENQIKILGWRQGSVFSQDLVSIVQDQIPRVRPAEPTLVVVSQDCDVVHRSFEVESKVEVIAAKHDTRPIDASYAHGRNPRQLQIQLISGRRFVFAIHDRFLIDRSLLAQHGPAEQLPTMHVDTLIRWITKRYKRAAFPDTFNERLRPATKKIDKALKRNGEHASGIFLMLDEWGELTSDHDYAVLIIVVFPIAVANDEEKEAQVARLAMDLLQAFDECDGIKVKDARHVSEDGFTLNDIRMYKRWDFDFRSYSGRPGGPVVPAD